MDYIHVHFILKIRYFVLLVIMKILYSTYIGFRDYKKENYENILELKKKIQKIDSEFIKRKIQSCLYSFMKTFRKKKENQV